MGPGDQIQIEVWLYWGNFVILMLESIGDSNSSSAEINIWSEGRYLVHGQVSGKPRNG